MFLRVFIISVLFCSKGFADPSDLEIPSVTSFTAEETASINSIWKTHQRKVASEMAFSESDLSADFKKFRARWLAVTNASQLTALLDESYNNYANYSPDVQYFLAQIHVMRDLRGIIWKLRPLFEKGSGFIGNNSTHVTAIQFVRTFVTGLSAAIPTKQTDVLIEYFTTPSSSMTAESQFASIANFQQFLAYTYGASLRTSSSRLKSILVQNPGAVWKWDNQMFYGTGTFSDDIVRISGHGAAEMHVAIAGAAKALHDVFVFAAYNQSAALDVASSLGRAMGVDVIGVGGSDAALALTDQERSRIILDANRRNSYLKILARGPALMKSAYAAKKLAVENIAEAYHKLKGKSANRAMSLNPGVFQAEVQDRLFQGIENMSAVVKGPTEVRDPITGKTVRLNLPAFYNEPPANLAVLMANAWEGGSEEKEFTGANGARLKARNYLRGRAISWNNDEWSKYVPSASAQPKKYMLEAKRIMHYSMGTAPVFGITDLFVR